LEAYKTGSLKAKNLFLSALHNPGKNFRQMNRHTAAVSSLCPDCHKKKTASVALSEEEQPDEEAKDEE
tara:strand:+ start:652 stop:855 length:204 start_codon:yes stop_codon:yes gene_type:complete